MNEPNRYICGEHGPEFVGYEQPTFWNNWKGTIGVAVGLLICSTIIMVLA